MQVEHPGGFSWDGREFILDGWGDKHVFEPLPEDIKGYVLDGYGEIHRIGTPQQGDMT